MGNRYALPSAVDIPPRPGQTRAMPAVLNVQRSILGQPWPRGVGDHRFDQLEREPADVLGRPGELAAAEMAQVQRLLELRSDDQPLVEQTHALLLDEFRG